jgi:PAS domain S-box-containing protein
MEITKERRPRLQAVAAQLLVGTAGLALITFVCFRVGFGITRTAFAYLILIALISLLGSFSASVVLSIVAVACLNYFFALPLFEFRIDDPDDIVRIAAFLTTSLVVTALTTRRKGVEEELTESRTRLEEAQRLAHVGWWERDLVTGQVTVSDEVCRILGERPVAHWLNLIFPEDRPKVAEAAAAALRPGGPRYDVEYRVLRPDGTPRVIRSQGDVSWDDSGRPLRQFGVLQDITELRQAEQELRGSEARFRTFVDHATDAFFVLDNDWTVLDANRQACEGLGYSREELIGRSKSNLDVGLDHASIQRLKERMVAGEAITFETRHRRKGGTSFPVEVRVSQFEQGGRRYLCLARDITERKRAEDELRESEERFRTIVQFSFDVYWESDAQHRFTRQMFAEDLADAPAPGSEIGKTRWEVPYLEPDQEAWRKHRETLDAHLPFRDFELARPTPDGGKRYVSVSGLPVFDRAGHFIGYRGVGRHITARKLIEVSLRERERELREILETVPAMTVTVLPDGSNVFIGKRFSEYSGLSEEEGQGSGWKACVHPDDVDLHVRKWRLSLQSGEPIEIETRFRRADGEYRWFLARAAPLRDEAGNILKWYEILTDIEDRKRAEARLRESQAKLEAAQRIAHVGWWERDFATGHVSLSDEVCRIFGVQPVELPQWHARWLKLIHPEDQPRAAEAAAAALLPGGPRYDLEYRVVRPDGTERIVHSQGDVTWDESGRPLRQFGVLQDITELRQAEKGLRASEEALRRSETYLAEAQRLSHTGTLAFNATAPVYWSDESYRIWGLDPQQGLPNRETVFQRIHPDDRERVNVEIDEALRQPRDFALEFRIVLPDGTIKHIESTGRPLFYADGQLFEMVATHVDVTERKRAQEEHERLRQLESDLAHVNRMSMMGELTASLAHEILHPIATARNNARAAMRFLDMTPSNMDEVREALACIVRDADRGKEIVDRIRDHIKKAPPRNDRFDLNEAITEVIEMVRAPIEKNAVSVRTSLSPGLTSVCGDRVQLQQVALNLILNAVEAMGPVKKGARELSISTKQDQKSNILVAVQDSGPGIDPEHLDRVFAPFYTTKASGIGMGLSICQSIIAAHGGRLWAETNRPRGAIFQFTLPAGLQDS